MQFYMRNNVFKNNIVYVGEHGRALASKSGRMDGSTPTVTLDHNIYYFPSGATAPSSAKNARDGPPRRAGRQAGSSPGLQPGS
jgi:hypothetical protein